MANSLALNCDCYDYMKTLPDKYFDLVVADPPYGAGFTEGGGCQGWFAKYHQDAETDAGEGLIDRHNLRGRFSKYDDGTEKAARKKIISWDVAPGKEVFNEMFRVSRNQIIWGGNYFDLPPTRCFLIWRKLSISENFTMAMAEYAWTSFNENAKVYEAAPQGKPGDERFHPTQKPIDLYRWIFSKYAKDGQKIFDPFLGSGSSRIAAYDAGLDFVGCEIDPVYFRKQEERFASYTTQERLEGW